MAAEMRGAKQPEQAQRRGQPAGGGGGLPHNAKWRRRTLTRSFRYTFSLFGAVRCFFLLRPPAFKSIPCAKQMQVHEPGRCGRW